MSKSLELFLVCLQIIFRIEGGWYDGDGGTNYGILASTLREANRLGIVHETDIRQITRTHAAKIYYKMYWLPSGAGQLNWPLCLVVFDSAIHTGVGTSRGLLSQAIKEAGINQQRVAIQMVVERWKHLKSLKKFPKRPGWRDRMNIILRNVIGISIRS